MESEEVGTSLPTDDHIPIELSTTPTPAPSATPLLEAGSQQIEELDGGSGKKLKSVVWIHFTKKQANGKDMAQCNYCKKLLTGTSKNGTNHLRHHMEKCMARKCRDIRQSILAKDTKGHLVGHEFDQEVARNNLAKMIILHEYPLAMVDHVGFRNFLSSVQPLFKCPTRNTIKSDVLEIYDYEKNKVMKNFEKNASRIAITSDMWTSSNQKKGFMAVTAHFVDNSWTLQSHILRFIYVPCPHTSEVLSTVLVDCLLDWNIDSKLSTITLDNCTTNDAMINDVKSKLDVSTMLESGSILHMRCAAHILNLIVKDGLDVIKIGVENIRESVSYWTATPKRVENFEETVRQLQISHTKRLSLDCSTRWNSTYLMLQTALMYRHVFVRLKKRDSQYKHLPSDTDWDFASQVCEKLKIFYASTELFSGTQYPTVHLFFRKICQIKLALRSWLDSDNEVIRKMANNMLLKFDKYWGVVHDMMGVAAILDPRYKMQLVEFYFEQLYGEESLFYVGKVRNRLDDLVMSYDHILKGPMGSVTENSASTMSNRTMEVDDALLDLFLEKNKRVKVTLVTELEVYLAADTEPKKNPFDILYFWNTSGLKYPTLRAIARDILAIPVSTVASESAFSTSGRLVSPHRSRLHPKTIEALMCSQSWLCSSLKKGSKDEVASLPKDCYASILEDEEDDDNTGMSWELEVFLDAVPSAGFFRGGRVQMRLIRLKLLHA